MNFSQNNYSNYIKTIKLIKNTLNSLKFLKVTFNILNNFYENYIYILNIYM